MWNELSPSLPGSQDTLQKKTKKNPLVTYLRNVHLPNLFPCFGESEVEQGRSARL